MMMYNQYIQEWKKYKAKYGDKVCFLMLVGKFYELYDILDKETQEGQTNVKEAVEIMGIQLPIKKGDGPHGEDCYAAGFPEQSLQKFVTMLTKENWTVVVTQQDKNSAGKVTGRPVERIFSPGTHIESAGMETPYLAGLWLEEGPQRTPPSFAAVSLDLTTGNVFSFEGEASGTSESWTSDELVNFFQLYKPKELVLFWRGDAFTMPTEQYLRMRFELPSGLVHLHHADSNHQGPLETTFVRSEVLKRIFSEHGLLSVREYLNLSKHEKTERCMVNILLFAEEHFPAAVKNISSHTVWTPKEALYLGNHSLVQLNYLTLQSEESVYSLFQRTLTTLGRRALKARLLQPSCNSKLIERKLKELDYCMETPPQTVKTIETQLRLMFDIARLHRKISTYTCEALDILGLEQSYTAISALFPLIGGTGSPFCFEPWLPDFQDMRKEFHRIFDVEKAARLANQEADISFFRNDVAPETREVETSLQALLAEAKASVQKIAQEVGLPEDGITLEVRGGESSLFQASIKKTLAQTIKNRLANGNPHGIQLHIRNTVKSYIEYPHLTRIAFAYEEKRMKLQQAIQKELPGLCLQCMNACEQTWEVLEDWVGRIDCNYTLAKVCRERGYSRPRILDSQEYSGFEAEGLRHPLLESLQSRVEYVKHNVSLGYKVTDDKGWLLYGMNASGKSSLMKAIGIAVLLAQCGCYVPATRFSLIPFRSLLTRILNHDNLWAGLSSFAVEMSELRDIFSRAEAHSLVLGDELCSGTESVSATSLVAAGIQYLTKKQTRFVFATHLHGLQKLDTFEGVGVWHLKCHYDIQQDKLIYDRTLHPGSGTTLYGIEVAKAMHIPLEIIDAAFNYRRTLEGETTVSEAKKSQWNPAIILHTCERCKCKIKNELEVHHIKQRKDADSNGRFEDGSHQNDLKNLIVLCKSCHDAHHRGEFEIGPLQMTDKGESRVYSPVTTPPPSQDSNKQIVLRYLREYPNMSPKLLSGFIQSKEGILISKEKIAAIRKQTKNEA
jgi:DNA mismatch repair protein MutS